MAGAVLTLNNVTKAGGKEICATGHESFPMEKTDTIRALLVRADTQGTGDADSKAESPDLMACGGMG